MSTNDIPPEVYERAEILCDQFRHIEDDRELIARVLMEVATKPRPGLTEGQARALSFIEQRSQEVEYLGVVSPSYREIAQGLSIATSKAHSLVNQLEERGYVTRLAHRPRSIAIVGRA
jgi:DNA-binding MarR family transcriptional regulator